MAKKLTEKNVLLLSALLDYVQQDKELHKAVVQSCGQGLADKIAGFAEQGDDLDAKRDNDLAGYTALVVSTIKSLIK